MVILFPTDDNHLICHFEEEYTKKKRENDVTVESSRNEIKELAHTNIMAGNVFLFTFYDP